MRPTKRTQKADTRSMDSSGDSTEGSDNDAERVKDPIAPAAPADEGSGYFPNVPSVPVVMKKSEPPSLEWRSSDCLVRPLAYQI